MATTLDLLRVDARRGLAAQITLWARLSPIEVDVFEVEGVDVAREVPGEPGRSLAAEYKNRHLTDKRIR